LESIAGIIASGYILETFTKPREFAENPRYLQDPREIPGALDLRVIDLPIVELIEGFSLLPHCFTLQS
jgi:hypothetical protein